MARKMPKYPKGLKSSISKLEKQIARDKAIENRKKEIEKLRAKKAALLKKKRGF